MPTRELTLRRVGEAQADGLRVIVRGLTPGETQRFRVLHPRPQPEMVPDLRGNPDRTPLVPKANCPSYNAAVSRWQYQTMVLEVSAAMGLSLNGFTYKRGMPDGDLNQWIIAVLRAFGMHTGTSGGGDGEGPGNDPPLTSGELQMIADAVAELGDPLGGDEGGRIEDAKKGLSALSRTGLEAVAMHLQSLLSPSASASP